MHDVEIYSFSAIALLCTTRFLHLTRPELTELVENISQKLDYFDILLFYLPFAYRTLNQTTENKRYNRMNAQKEWPIFFLFANCSIRSPSLIQI